jgi:hypothetical protein
MAKRTPSKSNESKGEPNVQRQIRISADQLQEIRRIAAIEEKNMNAIYREAADELLEARRDVQTAVPDDFYTAPLEDAKPHNIALPETMMAKIEKIAPKDKVTASRVIYTAIVKYLKGKGQTVAYIKKPSQGSRKGADDE